MLKQKWFNSLWNFFNVSVVCKSIFPIIDLLLSSDERGFVCLDVTFSRWLFRISRVSGVWTGGTRKACITTQVKTALKLTYKLISYLLLHTQSDRPTPNSHLVVQMLLHWAEKKCANKQKSFHSTFITMVNNYILCWDSNGVHLIMLFKPMSAVLYLVSIYQFLS